MNANVEKQACSRAVPITRTVVKLALVLDRQYVLLVPRRQKGSPTMWMFPGEDIYSDESQRDIALGIAAKLSDANILPDAMYTVGQPFRELIYGRDALTNGSVAMWLCSGSISGPCSLEGDESRRWVTFDQVAEEMGRTHKTLAEADAVHDRVSCSTWSLLQVLRKEGLL